jgi:hypothetical protein
MLALWQAATTPAGWRRISDVSAMKYHYLVQTHPIFSCSFERKRN